MAAALILPLVVLIALVPALVIAPFFLPEPRREWLFAVLRLVANWSTRVVQRCVEAAEITK